MDKFKNIYSSMVKKVQTMMVSDQKDDPVLADAPAVTPEEKGDYRQTQKFEVIDMDIDTDIEADPKQVRKIFNTVVEEFNRALPEFLASSVNADKQKQYLYDALEDSVKEYLTSLDQAAQARSMAQWKKERETQLKEMESLRERSREFEAKKAEYAEQRLSADRQKRALNERVRDLEKQLAQAQAEKEQLEIENKSMINKARIAATYESDIEVLKAELEELRKHPIPEETLKELEGLRSKVAELETEKAKLNDAFEAAKMKDEMGDAMVNNMQKKASEALHQLKDAEKTIATLEDKIQLKEAQIADLKHDVEEKDAIIAEERSSLEEIQEIAQQIKKFQAVKDRLDERVRELTEKLNAAEKENETLRSTIKNNLYDQAEQQKVLQDEINELKNGKKDNNTSDVLLDLTNE